MSKTIYFLFACIVLVAMVGTACGRSAPVPAPTSAPTKEAVPEWQARWDKTLAAAKQEGSVRMYIIMSTGVREELAKGFQQKYGIELEYVAAPPADIAQRFISEASAGRNQADVFNTGGTTLLTVVKPKGLIVPFEPELILPEVTDPKAWIEGRLPFTDKEGYMVGMISSYESYATRNTDLVKDNEITSFKDLLEPKWKGKLVINDPTTPGAGASFVAFLVRSWGEEETKAYLRKLVTQDLVMTRDWRQQIEWVAKGKYYIAIAPNPDNVTQFMNVGAPISPLRAKEGGVKQTVSAGLSLPKDPPHPNARTIFVNWLLSKEGMTALQKGFGQPTSRVDISLEGVNPIFLPGPGDKVLPEVEEHFTIQAKMFPAVREIFASLMQ